ncbi:MAG: UvrB/UvrC motif-containing protein, partial [Muribaculaceae bacterium]|nr:UvrB/UvrC motif-containing protein [Muribaculaceae bacterium]
GYEDESEDSLRLMMEQAVKDEDYENAGEIKLDIERSRASAE